MILVLISCLVPFWDPRPSTSAAGCLAQDVMSFLQKTSSLQSERGPPAPTQLTQRLGGQAWALLVFTQAQELLKCSQG